MPRIIEPVFPDRQVSIETFGARGDGVTLNTKAISKAIDSLSRLGGGTVIIPSGLWLTGPIELKSNICVKTEKGALVIFTKD